jgi:intein-encoded DNA endonuclease-like protein
MTSEYFFKQKTPSKKHKQLEPWNLTVQDHPIKRFFQSSGIVRSPSRPDINLVALMWRSEQDLH